MSLALLGIGTATPAHAIRQPDAATLAATFTAATDRQERTLSAIYRQTGILSRGSVLLGDPGPEAFVQTFFPAPSPGATEGPTTAARMDRYAAEAGRLALAAATRALASARIDAAAITHLVTCSCTGFVNPGVDVQLVAGLGLSPTVARTHVGFMGCHGAFNALRVAEAFVAARPECVPMVVCVELCSLHFRYGAGSDAVVANALFADGAAAVVGGDVSRLDPRTPAWILRRQWSAIIPDSLDDMSWTIGDHGFRMHLSSRVPAVLGDHVPRAVAAGLDGEGLRIADVGSWAVHPGGPRVLSVVETALGLEKSALAASRDVLSSHGNMSSATILFILEGLLRGGAAAPCVAMAFGPGLTAEMALLERR